MIKSVVCTQGSALSFGPKRVPKEIGSAPHLLMHGRAEHRSVADRAAARAGGGELRSEICLGTLSILVAPRYQCGSLSRASAVNEARSLKSLSRLPSLSGSGKPSC